jgi:hypothetical protein
VASLAINRSGQRGESCQSRRRLNRRPLGGNFYKRYLEKAMYTEYYIQNNYIYGPTMSGQFYIQNGYIYGPKNNGLYYIQNNYVYGPKESGKFYIQDGHIYGPTKALPWMID